MNNFRWIVTSLFFLFSTPPPFMNISLPRRSTEPLDVLTREIGANVEEIGKLLQSRASLTLNDLTALQISLGNQLENLELLRQMAIEREL